MKTTIKFLALFLVTASAFCQTSEEADKQLIKDLIEDSFQEIFSENKKETLSQHYTNDFILLEDGEVWDMEKVRNMMDMAAARGQLPERINSFEYNEVKISGDMAWTAYHNKAIFKQNGEVVGEMNWLESASAIRTEEGWKLQLLHSTVIKNEQD